MHDLLKVIRCDTYSQKNTISLNYAAIMTTGYLSLSRNQSKCSDVNQPSHDYSKQDVIIVGSRQKNAGISACDKVWNAHNMTSANNAAFHSCREVVNTRSRDSGNHEFTTCQWNAF